MKNWRLPRPGPAAPHDAGSMAMQVAEYRKSLLAQGIPEELADKLTVEFQSTILNLAMAMIAGIQTQG